MSLINKHLDAQEYLKVRMNQYLKYMRKKNIVQNSFLPLKSNNS